MRAHTVIPAQAGTPGREVSAGLPEAPAFAGVTGLWFPPNKS
jgi:hypothetical protein